MIARGPRIGRADRLAALPERSAERFRYHGLTGPPAVERLLAAPVPGTTPAPTARRPRRSTSDRLAALLARREAEDALVTGMPSVLGLLMRRPATEPEAPPPAPPAARAPAAVPAAQRAELVTAASALAEQLMPLPMALSEIAKKITRHCAVAGRDAELARAVEQIRTRTWDLFVAINRLAEAAGRGTAFEGGTNAE